MADGMKTWTKELDQISNEVKKFVNNVKVCSKANPLEDDLISQRKSEILEKLDALENKLKSLENDGEQLDAKLVAVKAKLIEKIEALKTKLENCTTSQTKGTKIQGESKTLKKESSKTSRKKRDMTAADSAENVHAAGLELSKKENNVDQSKSEKSTGKKSRKFTTEPGQSQPFEADVSGTKETETTRTTSKKSKTNKQDGKSETASKETESLDKTSKRTKVKKEKEQGSKQTKKEKKSKGKTEDVQKSKPESIEDIPSEVDAPSTLPTEIDQATDGLDDVVSELEDFSLTTDNASFTAAVQPKPATQTKPTGILKKWSEPDIKIETKSDRPNESIPLPQSVVAIKKGAAQSELFVAIRGWTGEEQDDLTFEPGCKLTVLQKNDDGWWLAKDTSGKTGLVPMNFLRPASDERPLKMRDGEAGRILVQEAFAKVFQMEDAEDAMREENAKKITERADSARAPDTVNDTCTSAGLGVQSQQSRELSAIRKQATHQDREKLTREAFAEVFRLEDEAEQARGKHAGVRFSKTPEEDTKTSEMVASLNDEDTLTLDELVEENLSAARDPGNQQMAQIKSTQPQAEVTPGDSGTVSVKERVNQWEQKVHGKRITDRSMASNKNIPVSEVQSGKRVAEQHTVDKDQEEVDNHDVYEDDDFEKEEEEEEGEEDEEENEDEVVEYQDEKEEDIDEFNKPDYNDDENTDADAEVEEENDDNEKDDDSEFTDNEVEDADGIKLAPAKQATTPKNNLMKRAATWLYQSNAKLLKSLEPLPAGVRMSTLASVDWQTHNYQTFLIPKLGSSHLMLVDLIYDSAERRIMRRPARIQRIVQIQKCFNMPLLNETNVTIQERVARICLFDGQKPLSNVVRVPMATTDRDRKQWCLMPQNLLRETKPNDLPADFFVRFNHMDVNVQVLIEIGISVTKASEEIPIELSVGWILVPLYDEKGVIVTNRTTDFPLQPGTPYEESVFGEESAKEETLRNRVQNMLFGRQPQVTVRVGQPTRDQQALLETLPDVLIGLCGYLPLMSLYWEMLGNVLFGSKSNMVKESVYLRQVPPSCALFPYVADTPLLMEALRVSWNETLKDLPTAQRKNPEKLQSAYSDHFHRVIYPITCLLDVIPTGPTSNLVFEKKTELVLSLLRQTQTDPLRFYMSTEHRFLAFTTREFTCPIRISG